MSSTVYVTNANGSKQAARGYRVFGGLRYSEGTMPTDRRFTGQQEDATGIYYFNARYYDPQLGMFLSPDTIVPDPSSFLSYNRYAYANGNPLKYNDPSGHCPAPNSSTGNIVCVDFFIQSKDILFYTGEGDGRGFSSNSNPTQSRAYFYLVLDDEGQLKEVQSHINPSCTDWGCFQPLEKHNTFSAQQDAVTGNIQLSWNLTNGVSSNLLKLSDEIYEAEASIGSLAGGSVLVEAVGRLIPAINGEMILSMSDDQTYVLTELNRDPYPSLEIYQYHAGKLIKTIEQLPERGFIGNFGPVVWLNPIAPNERIDGIPLTGR